jgi:hypothetical protein
MRLQIAALLLAGVVACNKSQGSSACQTSIHGVLERALSVNEDDQETVHEFEKRLGDMLVNLCTEDRWSAPMLACLDEASDAATGRACGSKLSADQLSHLQKKMGEAMGLAGSGSAQIKH